MTTISDIGSAHFRKVRPVATVHHFAIGQLVQFRRHVGMPYDAAEPYRITRKLPVRDNLPEYRIRSANESHERVVSEDGIEPVRASQMMENVTLRERIFGHGQRTKT